MNTVSAIGAALPRESAKVELIFDGYDIYVHSCPISKSEKVIQLSEVVYMELSLGFRQVIGTCISCNMFFVSDLHVYKQFHYGTASILEEIDENEYESEYYRRQNLASSVEIFTPQDMAVYMHTYTRGTW